MLGQIYEKKIGGSIMKKYVILIWIYALSIIYMIAHVIPVIAFNADVYDDFFVRHYSLYYYSQPIISILFYALFEMSVICLSKKLKQTKREIIIDLLLIDLPAILGVAYYFGWGGIYNILHESPLHGSWLELFLIDERFREVFLIIASIMLGIEIMRYIDYFKYKSKSI